MPAPGDKRIRLILTVPQIAAVQTLLQEMVDGGQAEPEHTEVNNAFKVLLLKEELGLAKPISVVAAPRPTLEQKLGFPQETTTAGMQESPVAAPRKRTQEEMDAQIAAFDENELFAKIAALTGTPPITDGDTE